MKQTYRDFDDFWDAQTPSPDGSVTYSARANAIKGRVPEG